MNQFQNLGVIKNEANYNSLLLNDFIKEIENIRKFKSWKKTHLVDLFNQMIPDFKHKETGKYLDGRM